MRAQPLVKPFATGTVFAGRFEILALVGQGGMGAVYRARHLGLDKQVALKILRGAAPDACAARFEREARAVGRLDHPSCVRVLDHGTAGRSHYLAMELLDGPTLAAVLRDEGRFAPDRALRVASQLVGALAHAHGHGVIHRDVKPENIVLVHGGTRAVLIDFGLASLDDQPPLTAVGFCIGTPAYLAPERLLGRPHDARTDLYALGVVLYEMIAGVRPFAGATPEDTMRQAIHRPPRPLLALRPDVSPALDAVIRRALAKDPERRFADAEAMQSALAEVPALDAAAATLARDDAAATLALGELDVTDVIRPSLLARLWSWLRYGRWRWARLRG